MKTRRNFLATAGVGGAATLAAPAVHAQSTIRWRMQTYAGPALAEHVITPAVNSFNKIAGDEMQIELFFLRPNSSNRRTLPSHAARHSGRCPSPTTTPWLRRRK